MKHILFAGRSLRWGPIPPPWGPSAWWSPAPTVKGAEEPSGPLLDDKMEVQADRLEPCEEVVGLVRVQPPALDKAEVSIPLHVVDSLVEEVHRRLEVWRGAKVDRWWLRFNLLGKYERGIRTPYHACLPSPASKIAQYLKLPASPLGSCQASKVKGRVTSRAFY